jgi:hypothetical protein
MRCEIRDAGFGMRDGEDVIPLKMGIRGLKKGYEICDTG